MAKEVKLLQSVDPDGNVIALVRDEGDNRFVILAPVNQGNDLPSVVDISEADGHAELKSKIGGELVDIEGGDFDQQLKDWGYDGSDRYLSGGKGFKDKTRNDDEPGARTDGGTIQDPNHGESTGVDPDGDAKNQAPDPDANADDPSTKPDEKMRGETERQSAQDETKKEKAGI